MTSNRVTARKYQGDDAGSWAVFIDGRPFVTGLLKSEVEYYKAQARKQIEVVGCKQCGAPMNPVALMLGPVCGACTRKNHKEATK